MRICWLHQKLGSFGGAEANILATAGALATKGVENTLVYRERTGTHEEEWERTFAFKFEARDSGGVVDAVRRAGSDVIWIHNWSESGDFSLLRALGVPMARMVHDHALYCMRQYKYHPLTRVNCERPASAACIFPCLAPIQRGVGRWPLRWASYTAKLREIEANRKLDCLVVASTFMRGELLKNGFAADIIEMLPPVPPEPDVLPMDTGGQSEAGRMLFAGQVIRGKGLDLLLKALAGLAGNWTLAVAGQGNALAACKAMVERLGLVDRVEFLGHLSPGELAEQYRRTQMVVVPSAWQEPFGMIGVEAMRHARAVVGFDVGGIGEWLQHGINGITVPAGDVAALRDALVGLMDDMTACDQMGARGREIATRRFTFSNYVDNLILMMRRLSVDKLQSNPSTP